MDANKVSWLDEIDRSAQPRSDEHHERLVQVRQLAPTWPWREMAEPFTFEADLAGAFRVEVEGSAVYLYGHRNTAWLEHWFEGPGEEGLRKAIQACRAEIGRRVTELFGVLG